MCPPFASSGLRTRGSYFSRGAVFISGEVALEEIRQFPGGLVIATSVLPGAAGHQEVRRHTRALFGNQQAEDRIRLEGRIREASRVNRIHDSPSVLELDARP